MTDDRIPMLWLYGPRGVGKSTVGWEIYAGLRGSGVQAGYVDIDQLGMCYPESPSDPGRHRMKTRNLAAVTANFRAAGVRCMVVSGVVDPTHGVHDDLLSGVALTVCRLRAGRDELRRRYLGRGSDLALVEQALADADVLDADIWPGICVDTSGRTVTEVAREVRERAGAWPTLPAARRSSAVPAAHPGGPILWVCGPTGVGTSTIGFTVYLRAMRAGLMAGYVDIDQIGFCGSAAGDRVKARNLASLWHTYRAAGAQGLVVVGPVKDRQTITVYADALPAADLTVCRLHAGRERLTERIMSRGRGESWPEPGDPLRGRPTAELLHAADQAVADAERLERDGLGTRIDTDRCSPEEAADAILARTRWLEAVQGRRDS